MVNKIEAKKTKLLHAAAKLFLEKGYRSTTINDIAKETIDSLFVYLKNRI